MSLHHEQLRAIEMARDLLRDVVQLPQRTMIRSVMRQRAAAALRHFPPITSEGVILWSNDESDPLIANSERPKDYPA